MGNPGAEYADTPHNAGYRCIDGICRILSLHLTRMNPMISGKRTQWEEQSILLAKPLTYMNESGRALRWLKDSFALEPTDIYMIYDDIDLPLGTIRIREKGSAGTHKGMKSIVQHLQSQDFPRIRIGIQPRTRRTPALVRYVLTPVKKKDRDLFADGVEQAVSAVQGILQNGLKTTMNKYNRRNPNSLLLNKRLP